MKKKTLALLLLLVSFTTAGRALAQGPSSPRVTAFEHVNVIPMDRERVLRDQTVVVRDGLISEVGDARRVRVPPGALRIDGRGKYLMPGLVDMHTHLFTDDDHIPERLAGDELALMLANGVTTVRLMIGTPDHLRMRREVEAGRLLGPTLYVASPQLAGRAYGGVVFNGRVVKTAAEARAAVRDFKANGYDFIKLTTEITPEVYDAVTAEAKASGVRVVGHVDTRVGLRRALAAGQQIEHLDSYMEAVLRTDAPSKASVSDVGVWRKRNWESLDYVDDRKVEEVARATAAAGVYTCPTLTFFKLTFAVEPSEEEVRARPDYRFFPAALRESRHAALKRFWTEPPTAERRRRYQGVRDRLVKAIHDAGGKVLAGSDTPELFLLYGFTLHRELQNLVAAGLSPYAALAAATRNPAEYLRALDRVGTVARGRRADLLLLDANPLDQITNTERRAGVMVRGRWLPEAELHAMRERIAEKFQQAHAPTQAATQRAFFENVKKLCGQRFEGETVFPLDKNHPLAGKRLVMSVEKCGEDEIRIPFHVGEDKSRTWVLTLTDEGLLLKHDHRHADGTPDEVTMYGGLAAPSGTQNAQSFPADAGTAKLIPEAATNVWTLQIIPEKRQFVYQLERHKEPRYKALFNLRALP